MVKSKIRQYGLEYFVLNNNEDEVWEIDYDNGIAVNVSGYMKIDLVNTEVIRHSGSLEDFLVKARTCTNALHHKDMNIREKFYERIWTFPKRWFTNLSAHVLATALGYFIFSYIYAY